MAANLEKAAGRVETFIRALEKAMNPTSGTPQPGLVKQRGQDLKDKWTVYDALYQDMEYDKEAREAAENEYMDKYERYSIALGSASDILEAASSGAESVRSRSNSTSSQAGDEPTPTPQQNKASAKNKEHMVGEQIKNLEGDVEEENPTKEQVASLKNRQRRLQSIVEGELNQLYLQWAGSDAANQESIVTDTRAKTDKFLAEYCQENPARNPSSITWTVKLLQPCTEAAVGVQEAGPSKVFRPSS